MMTSIVLAVLLRQGSPQIAAYAEAASIVRSKEFRVCQVWLDGLRAGSTVGAPPEGLSRNASPLQVKSFMLSKFGRALTLLKTGNESPLVAADKIPADMKGAFTELAKFACDAASVKFGNGSWSAGVGLLIDAGSFGMNGFRLGGQVETLDVCFPAFAASQSRWSVSDCSRIRSWVRTALTADIGVDGKMKLRLLDLHAAIQKFRWEHARLPYRLAEVVSSSEAVDPAFEYVAGVNGTFTLTAGSVSLSAGR